MSLEERISAALHAADDYQPRVDLFSRLHRSIEEDLAHRRRARNTYLAVGLGILGFAVFFVEVASRNAAGDVTVPKWSLEIAVLVVLVTVLLTLGPILRRLGGPLIEEIFRLNPTTGDRFSRLLDIAYYLFFGGMIVSGFDPVGLSTQLMIPGADLWPHLAEIAGLLLSLGLAHVTNLALLPIVGLLFTSLTRRARRRAAGEPAPPVASAAGRADRIVTWMVMAAMALLLFGALGLIGFVLLAIGLP